MQSKPFTHVANFIFYDENGDMHRYKVYLRHTSKGWIDEAGRHWPLKAKDFTVYNIDYDSIREMTPKELRVFLAQEMHDLETLERNEVKGVQKAKHKLANTRKDLRKARTALKKFDADHRKKKR